MVLEWASLAAPIALRNADCGTFGEQIVSPPATPGLPPPAPGAVVPLGAVPAWEEVCAQIPGLTKTGANTWELAAESPGAFSGEAHARLAQIEPNSYWFNHRNDIIAAVVRRFPPNGPIFDVGGGNGYVSVGLKRAGFECVVVEPGEVGAANAARRGFAVIRAPFQNLTLADATIPSAGMFDVLEHIEDDASALANLHRVLKRGGRLYIAVPAYNILWSAEDVVAGHYRRYTLGSLSARLRQAGFVIDYGTYFFSILVFPIFLMRAAGAFVRPRAAGEVDQDHTLPGGLIGAVFRRSFARELSVIASGGSRMIGASCLIVARKT